MGPKHANPIHSDIIGGGIVQSLALDNHFTEDPFHTDQILTQDFKLTTKLKSRSLDKIARDFDQYKNHDKHK